MGLQPIARSPRPLPTRQEQLANEYVMGYIPLDEFLSRVEALYASGKHDEVHATPTNDVQTFQPW